MSNYLESMENEKNIHTVTLLRIFLEKGFSTNQKSKELRFQD